MAVRSLHNGLRSSSVVWDVMNGCCWSIKTENTRNRKQIQRMQKR